MATIDKTGCGPTNGVVPHSGEGKVYVMKNTVDLTGGAMTSGDVYQLLAIPANTLVMNVKLEIVTPAVGTTLTTDIGDGGAANGWDASVDGKGTAGTVTHSIIGTDARAAAAGQGYFYSSADSIDITMTTATGITAGPKFTMYATCVDFN
jgi:hypothetical protein